MYSVTQRIKAIKQPYGGYIPIKLLEKIDLDNVKDLHDMSKEFVPPGLMGTLIDYLVRILTVTTDKEKLETFRVSEDGLNLFIENFAVDWDEKAKTGYENAFWKFKKEIFIKVKTIEDLTKERVAMVLWIVSFDVVFRAMYPPNLEKQTDILQMTGLNEKMKIPFPNETYENIITMVKRSLNFFKKFGPVTKYGFTMRGGYTDTVSTGDGDFLTEDTLWDFKVSKKGPTSAYTLQVLMYFLMGKNRDNVPAEWQTLKKVGIFNPRLNKVYLFNVADLDQSIIDEVCTSVIGYEKPWNKAALQD